MKNKPMSRYDAGDQAFPRPSTSECTGAPGVDLLGYYAGLALQSILLQPAPATEWTRQRIAKEAVLQASALIDALNTHVEKP